MLEVQGLSFAYGPRPIVANLSFRAEAGSSVAVLGRSGVGKSTLLRLISGLLLPSSGHVGLDGERLIQDGAVVGDVAAFRRRVVLVPQEGGLWSTMSAAENIALPLQALRGLDRSAALDCAYQLAESVSIDRATLGRDPSQLSGGQKQKVALLRAIALGVSWVLLDEPTANLDPVSSHELARLVSDSRSQGLAAVIVTHDLAFARDAADTYYFLEAGKLLSQGRMAEIANDPQPAVQDFLQGS